MDRPPRSDDGSPARLIATMVGIVGILLLGSLAWSAVGALFSAVGEATGTLSGARATPVRLTAIAVTATPAPVAAVAAPTVTSLPTLKPTAVSSATPQPQPVASPTPIPQPAITPTPAAADGRAPWILLPSPAPGAKVAAGQTTIEARGRGDSTITTMRLELDGAPLQGSFEQRSDSIWRVSATAKLSPGQHAVRATVIDDQGRTGGYRWTFDVGP